jgi:hypothetical protein
MRLFAFEGLHYTGAADDVGRLAAPPYDQIDNAARDRFQAQSPHQFVHLTRPLPGGGLDMYRHAADLHAQLFLAHRTDRLEGHPCDQLLVQPFLEDEETVLGDRRRAIG